MVRLLKFYLSIIFAAALAACNRHGLPSTSSAASITIRAPSHVLASLPGGRTACFGVNVTGAGISTSQPNVCSPTTGIIAGFVPSGQDVTVTVPGNLVINVDLYLYLVPSGKGSACPTMTASFSPTLNFDTYLIGSASNISTGQAVTDVTITDTYTSSSQNIAQQMGMPSTCQVASSASGVPSPFTMSAGGVKTLTGTGINMSARVGETYGAKTLTGTGIKLIVR